MPAPFSPPFVLLERECKSPTRTFNLEAIFAPSPAPIPTKQAAGSGIRRESRRIPLGPMEDYKGTEGADLDPLYRYLELGVTTVTHPPWSPKSLMLCS